MTKLDHPLAVWTGLEPATPCVTGRYSNQLNYHTSFLALATELRLLQNVLRIAPLGGMDGTRTRDPLRDRQVF